MVKTANTPEADLERIGEAGRRALDCVRVLGKTDDNLVGEVLRNQGDFFEWDHFPKGDVYDTETHSQYYYHAHPAELRGGEHGHFHTFLRPKGMPKGLKPANLPDYEKPRDRNDDLSHLVAFSMDSAGLPIRIFTTNRWVTGESWYTADDVIKMLDHFAMDLAYPSWPLNVWITAMMQLFRPQIEGLIHQRDEALARWQAKHPTVNAYEDRDLEITSSLDISVEKRIAEIEKALASNDRISPAITR